MRIVFLTGCCVLALLESVAFPAERTVAPAGKAGAELPAVVPGALTRQRADLPPQGSARNRWRYAFHNGHWWFYRDGGRWSYWTGNQWWDYESKSYHRWYVSQKMADLDDQLARFDSRWMRPYMSPSLTNNSSGLGRLDYALPATPYATTSPWQSRSGASDGLFSPRAFDGRLNPATSIGGYMGGALRGPFGD